MIELLKRCLLDYEGQLTYVGKLHAPGSPVTMSVYNSTRITRGLVWSHIGFKKPIQELGY